MVLHTKTKTLDILLAKYININIYVYNICI